MIVALRSVGLESSFSSVSITVGFVFVDRAFARRLRACPYLRQVPFNVDRHWNMCCFDNKKRHCDFHGRRLKFKPRSVGFRVAWVCPRLVDVSFREFAYYG